MMSLNKFVNLMKVCCNKEREDASLGATMLKLYLARLLTWQTAVARQESLSSRFSSLRVFMD